MVVGFSAIRRWTAELLEPPAGPAPGLRAYRFDANGGYTQLHLRVEEGGAGLLFVDAMDVLYLTPTAAEIAWHALEGRSQAAATRSLLARYRGAPRARIAADVEQTYAMIQQLATPSSGCRTCDLPLQREAPFSRRASAPFKVDLALTYQCQNACPHCYNDPTHFDIAPLGLDGWTRILDLMHRVGVPHIILTGGEATLHPDLLAIVGAAARRGLICGLNSNGRRLARGSLARELERAGLAHLQVTLESHAREVHDAMVGARAFDDTVAGIRAAIQAGIPTITNTTLTRRNRDDVERTMDYLHGLGIRTFAMNGMIYSGGGAANPDAIPEEQLAPLLLRVRDHARALGMRFLWYTPTEYCRMNPVELEIGAKRCNAAEYSVCIEPDGSVLPCQSYYTAAGNVLRDPWEQIWNSELFRSFRDRELDPKGYGLPEKCWECPDLPLCGGGCRIEREARAKGEAGCGTCEGRGCHVSSAGGGRSSWNAPHPAALIPISEIPFRERRSSGAAAIPALQEVRA